MSEITPLNYNKHEAYHFTSNPSNDMQPLDTPHHNSCLQHVLKTCMSNNIHWTWKVLKNKRMQVLKMIVRTILFMVYFILSSMIGKIVTMAFVVPRVNVNSPPSPDILLDFIPHANANAFKVTEIMTGIMSFLLILIVILNGKERFSIPHRFLFISGTLLNLRTLCISVTTFSIPSRDLSQKCTNLQHLNRSILFEKAINFFEFSETCGDYVFSGHASALIIVTWFVWYYSAGCFTQEWNVSVRRWFNFTLLTLDFCGCFCIVIAKEHYTIDVILACVIGILFCVLYHSQLDLFRMHQKNHEKLRLSNNTSCAKESCLSKVVIWFYRLVEMDSLEMRIDEQDVESKDVQDRV